MHMKGKERYRSHFFCSFIKFYCMNYSTKCTGTKLSYVLLAQLCAIMCCPHHGSWFSQIHESTMDLHLNRYDLFSDFDGLYMSQSSERVGPTAYVG